MHKGKIINNNFYPVLILLAITLFVSSCRTLRPLPVIEVKPMTAMKVMRKVEREAPIYNNYEAKKMSIEFDVNNSRNSFSGQFKIKRNRCMILSIRKLSVPLGRGLISSDSIVFVNYFDKSYLTGNFNDVKKMLGFDIEYNLIQALFTGDVGKLIESDNYDKDLYAAIDSQMYRIDTHIDLKTNRTLFAGVEKRLNRNLKKTGEKELNDITLWIDPQNFVVRKISMKDEKSKENIVIQYNQYEMIGRNIFPQEVVFSFNSPNSKASFLIKISKSSVNADNDFSFSIPEKFEKAKFNVAN